MMIQNTEFKTFARLSWFNARQLSRRSYMSSLRPGGVSWTLLLAWFTCWQGHIGVVWLPVLVAAFMLFFLGLDAAAGMVQANNWLRELDTMEASDDDPGEEG